LLLIISYGLLLLEKTLNPHCAVEVRKVLTKTGK
jgi:hypothetical protein